MNPLQALFVYSPPSMTMENMNHATVVGVEWRIYSVKGLKYWLKSKGIWNYPSKEMKHLADKHRTKNFHGGGLGVSQT